MKYLLLTIMIALTGCFSGEVPCPDATGNYYDLCVTEDDYTSDEYVAKYCEQSDRRACPKLYAEWVACLASITDRGDCGDCFGSQWNCDPGEPSAAAHDLCTYRWYCVFSDTYYTIEGCIADVLELGEDEVNACFYSSPAAGEEWDRDSCDAATACIDEL